MTGAATPIESTFSSRARDIFLLKGAEQVVRSFTPEQHAVVRKLFDAAQRRASVADDLSDDRNAAVAFVLYREALSLTVAALVAAHHREEMGHENLRATTAFDRLEAMARSGEIPPLPPFVANARAILSEDDQLSFDRRSSEDLLSQRKYVEQTLRWLGDQIEPRTLNEIRATRVVRIFIIAALFFCLLAWVAVRATRPVNLAYRKPVTINGRFHLSTAPTDNTGLTNGDIESSYGILTDVAPPGGFSWVVVDLTKPTRFKRIKIYNRNESNFDDGLPMTLETSDDGTNFTVVETKATHFSQWIYEPAGGGTTRYIRVRSDKYVCLAEIEVN